MIRPGSRLIVSVLVVSALATTGVLDGAATGEDDGGLSVVSGLIDVVTTGSDADALDVADELQRGTNPATTDSDGDGLPDSVEVNRYDTDPTDSDTDGDGIPDGAEVSQPERFPGADPNRPDVYVEVDTARGVAFDESSVENIERTFENAPADIEIHFVFDERVPYARSVNATEDLPDYAEIFRDYDGYGYYYLLVVPNLDDSCSCVGKIDPANSERMVVEEYGHTENTVMHELGHAMGLAASDYTGIDSHEYSYEEYPSVMNYNRNRSTFAFSDGDAGPNDFDDWNVILHDREIPDTSKIDTETRRRTGPNGSREPTPTRGS